MRRATPRLEPLGPLPTVRVGCPGRAVRVRRVRAAVRPGPDDPGGARRHETGDCGRPQRPRPLEPRLGRPVVRSELVGAGRTAGRPGGPGTGSAPPCPLPTGPRN